MGSDIFDGIWGVRLHECNVKGEKMTCVYASDLDAWVDHCGNEVADGDQTRRVLKTLRVWSVERELTFVCVPCYI